MRGLEGKGDYSERGKIKKQRDTRIPNEVRQQTSVTCGVTPLY